jgi:phosphatidylinositol glycan class A protein
MVCDFFYPQPGGVEFHIYHLAQQLIARGHNVVVITHSYKDRRGIRYLTNGLRVYYIPFLTFYRNTTFPTVFSAFPILRNIFVREKIDIVHGHASMSSLAHEAIIHGQTMGLKTILTEHSLFGFADVGSILGNKTLKFTLMSTDRTICVSHTCKENVVLRGAVDPQFVSVIPNAVISDDFKPGEIRTKHQGKITIVVISRLFPNKGADLLAALIPKVCQLNPNVHFLVAGDGPKFVDIQQSIETHRLQDRVELIGGVKHERVRDVMIQGDIYLHPTLTEAFGTVLVEAASCGLLVVTTRVGGIPEVLPTQMTIFAKPSVDSLVKSTSRAIKLINEGKVDTSKFHEEVKSMYSWEDVARRTEAVYNSIRDEHKLETIDQIKRLHRCGAWAGKLFVLCFIVDIFVLAMLEWLYPREKIQEAVKWPKQKPDNIQFEDDKELD